VNHLPRNCVNCRPQQKKYVYIATAPCPTNSIYKDQFHHHQRDTIMGFRHPSFTFFLLFLSFYFLSMSTLARPQSHSPNTVVDIRNDLPNNTKDQLELRCGHSPFFVLKLGHHYNSTIPVDQDFECIAASSRWFTTWDVYHVKRDKGYQTVYWSVRNNGFYHSWDGSTWKLLEKWYSD